MTQAGTGAAMQTGEQLTRPDGRDRSVPRPAATGADAEPGQIGLASLRYSARLAGLSGAVLLILAALVAWLGTSATGLDSYWLAWAALPAMVAAFGGTWLGTRRVGRESLAAWRLALLALMTLNGSAWAWVLAIADGAHSHAALLLVIGWLGSSVALLPTISWLSGLAVQLAVQLGVCATFVLLPGSAPEAALLPLGLWLTQALLAWMAAVYARRVDLSKADAQGLRFEAAELQRRMSDAQLQLQQAREQRATLEAELAEILDLAESASRAKTEFLATMSHEIRTPLNGILPILDMLGETRLDEEQKKMVRTARSSSRHLLRIISDILDFAKVESGKLQLETIEVDVRDLVGSVVELMSGSARNQDLKLSFSVADNVPGAVRGDPVRLRQVLINLISNAIKFTEEGGIRVEVSRGQTSQKEIELLFAVADTGAGMEPETADRLFQPFTQADASTTRKHGGTGLGLVICKRLVELMGGRIGVRSTPGQGSTFWFLVPLRKSVREVPSARRDLDGVRVLTLIRDEQTAAKVAQKMREWRVVQSACSDVDEALEKLRSAALLGATWTHQLLLMDGTGFEARLPELLAEVRGMEALKRMPVVLSLRSETLAHKLKRDYGVMVLAGGLRPEPVRRMLYRLFDVESRPFGSSDPRAEEIYDDLNVSADDIVFGEAPLGPAAGAFSGRALLVEDNPVNLAVVQKAVAKLGLGCETASDGEEALARIEREHFDIVFMDIQMPVMDGYEATRRMRRLEQSQGRAPTPVVAMTANAMAGDRERCIDAGMDDYLAKPINLDELRACVSDWLGPMYPGRQRTAVAAPEQGERETMPVLEPKVLRELKEVMGEDYLSLLHTYLRNAPQLLAQVRDAVSQSDVGAMMIPLHSLKSSSANVGAMHLSDLAREAERHARTGDFAAAEAAFNAVDIAFDQADAALREHIAGLSAA